MGGSRLNQGLADTPNPWPELDLQDIYGKACGPHKYCWLLHTVPLQLLLVSAFEAHTLSVYTFVLDVKASCLLTAFEVRSGTLLHKLRRVEPHACPAVCRPQVGGDLRHTAGSFFPCNLSLQRRPKR